MPNTVETFPYECVRKGARKDIRPKRSRRMARRGAKGVRKQEDMNHYPINHYSWTGKLDWDGRSGRGDQNGRITAMGPGCDETVHEPVREPSPQNQTVGLAGKSVK